MTTSTHPVRSALSFTAGTAVLAALLLALFLLGRANADPSGPIPVVATTPAADSPPVAAPAVASAPAAPASSIMTVLVVVAVVLGGTGAILGGLSTVLHAIASRTKNTWDDRMADVVDKVSDLNATVLELLKRILPTSAPVSVTVTSSPAAAPMTSATVTVPDPTDLTKTQVMRRAPESGRAALTTLLAVAALGLAILGAACGTWRERTGAAVGAGIDCEAPNLKAAALELLGLASPAIKAVITGDGHVDKTQFKAALATIKTDAPRCAVDAAIAALLTPAPAQPNAAMAAPFEVNAAELRAAYAETAAELGWPAIKSAGVRAALAPS